MGESKIWTWLLGLGLACGACQNMVGSPEGGQRHGITPGSTPQVVPGDQQATTPQTPNHNATTSGTSPNSQEPVDPLEPGPCTTDEVPSPTLRRLSRIEYQNSVRDLLGVNIDVSNRLPPDEEALIFHINTSPADTRTAELLLATARAIAEQSLKKPDMFLPCALDELNDGCVHEAIDGLTRRAFRRPVDKSVRQVLFDQYHALSQTHGPGAGLEAVISSILQAPDFLYRLANPQGQSSDLDDYDLAARLSFTIWQSIPDDSLLEAAKNGTLKTADNIEAEARRMLQDPRARATLVDFHRQWLQFDELDGIQKDAKAFSDFDEELVDAMQKETEHFIDDIIWNEGGRLKDLLAAPWTFVNRRLANFYGIDAPDGKNFEKRTLASKNRRGLLTQASWLAVNAAANRSAPTRRGLWIRENLLCQSTPSPPPNQILPELVDGQSTRQRFETILDSPTCHSCHRLMDPIGFGFEGFDAVGHTRETDGDETVRTHGYFAATDDLDGDFAGATEVAEALSESEQVRHCVTKQWFRYTLGRLETAQDQCSLGEAYNAFEASDYDVRELLVALTRTDAFRFRGKVQ